MAVDYREIPGFPGYRVGDDGSVWSCWIVGKRGTGNGRGASAVLGDSWKRLKLSTDDAGRHFLTLCRDRKKHHRRVCRLVLEAFVGPCPPGMEACHFPDRDPTNNRLDNLRWDTKTANCADAIAHGTTPRGERHPQARLTDREVLAIRGLLKSGKKQRDVAAQFGVSHGTVGWIATGKTWSHLREVPPCRI